MKRLWVVGILILSFAGLADATYLTQSEITGTPLICNVQNLSGCNIVANSSYSHIFGIPLAEFGMLFYGLMFVLAALELVLFDQLLRRAIQVIALIGILSSLYFTATQIFFIGAFCVYCIASAVITLFSFIFATRIEPIRLRRRPVPVHEEVPPPPPPPTPPYFSMPPAA